MPKRNKTFTFSYTSVGIATRYGLDSPEIESRWRRDFPHPARSALGPPSLLCSGYQVPFPGHGVNHPPPPGAEVKERVELYLYSPFASSLPVLGRTSPLPFDPNARIRVFIELVAFIQLTKKFLKCCEILQSQ